MSTTIGCTTGVFDLFQVAHLDLLRRAGERCDQLVVILPTDACTEAFGLPRPIVPHDERAAIVREIEGVDDVVVLAEPDLAAALRQVRPRLLLSHQLDLPGAAEVARGLGLPVGTLHGLRMSASELLRIGGRSGRSGRSGDDGVDALNSVA